MRLADPDLPTGAERFYSALAKSLVLGNVRMHSFHWFSRRLSHDSKDDIKIRSSVEIFVNTYWVQIAIKNDFRQGKQIQVPCERFPPSPYGRPFATLSDGHEYWINYSRLLSEGGRRLWGRSHKHMYSNDTTGGAKG
jgi:hypothetical protein